MSSHHQNGSSDVHLQVSTNGSSDGQRRESGFCSCLLTKAKLIVSNGEEEHENLKNKQSNCFY